MANTAMTWNNNRAMTNNGVKNTGMTWKKKWTMTNNGMANTGTTWRNKWTMTNTATTWKKPANMSWDAQKKTKYKRQRADPNSEVQTVEDNKEDVKSPKNDAAKKNTDSGSKSSKGKDGKGSKGKSGGKGVSMEDRL